MCLPSSPLLLAVGEVYIQHAILFSCPSFLFSIVFIYIGVLPSSILSEKERGRGRERSFSVRSITPVAPGLPACPCLPCPFLALKILPRPCLPAARFLFRNFTPPPFSFCRDYLLNNNGQANERAGEGKSVRQGHRQSCHHQFFSPFTALLPLTPQDLLASQREKEVCSLRRDHFSSVSLPCQGKQPHQKDAKACLKMPPGRPSRALQQCLHAPCYACCVTKAAMAANLLSS